MIDIDNQTNLTFDINALEKIASWLSDANVELLVVDDKTMQELNTIHRDKASATDVLSFPMDTPFTPESIMGFPLGSIVISKNHVLSRAEEHGHSAQDELSLLFIHGMLHLLGFDHETDNGEMRQKEEEVIAHFNLPKSLIVRTGV